jgi:hypothetical protein
MSDADVSLRGGRGAQLLLVHCDALTGVEDATAYERLEEQVGHDLARMLVAALARRRVRERLAA